MSDKETKKRLCQRILSFFYEVLDFADERKKVGIAIVIVFSLLICVVGLLPNKLAEWHSKYDLVKSPLGVRDQFHYTAHFLCWLAFLLSAGHSKSLASFLRKLDKDNANVILEAKFGLEVLYWAGVIALFLSGLYAIVLLFSFLLLPPEVVIEWSLCVITLLCGVLILFGIFVAWADHLLLHRDLVLRVDLPFTFAMALIFVFSTYFSDNFSAEFITGVASGSIALQLILTVLVVPRNSYTPETIIENFSNKI